MTVRELEDGMGYLGLVHDWTTISAIEQTVRADGRRLQRQRRATGTVRDTVAHDGSSPDVASSGVASSAVVSPRVVGDGHASRTADLDETDGTADACRADALAARILGQVGPDGGISWERETPQVEVQVVMDLATLRGEDDHPCLLDGAPVTADLARHVAGYATAFRRLVTAPVSGHLLDYGHRVYLPGPLRTYVLARDGRCATPGCLNRAASRLQMDHATPFPAGPSTPANSHARCTTCHQLKTAGHARITDTDVDGSHTWRSGWGQTVRIPARRLLPGRDDPPVTSPPPDVGPAEHDPPPF